jgi:hypothetical protein
MLATLIDESLLPPIRLIASLREHSNDVLFDPIIRLLFQSFIVSEIA